MLPDTFVHSIVGLILIGIQINSFSFALASDPNTILWIYFWCFVLIWTKGQWKRTKLDGITVETIWGFVVS